MESQLLQSLNNFLRKQELQPLVEQIAGIGNSEVVEIRLMNPEFDWVPIGRLLNKVKNLPSDSYDSAFSRAVAERVVATQRYVDVADISSSMLRSQSLAEQALKSFACFPIITAGRVIGALFIASSYVRDPLNETRLGIFARLCTTLAYFCERERYFSRESLARQQDGRYGIVSVNTAMQQILDLLPRIARSAAPVLISGETGTGKELLAQAIHRLSDRKSKRFVTVHCGALSETLLESELFGHVKGAFTGADSDRQGSFGLADGGTIFLDEITTASPELQVKLLRVLEYGEIRPVGSPQSRHVDVRVIVAGNEDLPVLVEQHRFRRDLFYRLQVVDLQVPPLRERRDDIPLLVRHFLKLYAEFYGKKLAGISDDVVQDLQEREWDGNVRQLKNMIEKLVILCDADTFVDIDVAARLLPAGGPQQAVESGRADFGRFQSYRHFKEASLHNLERDFLLQALEQCYWNESRTARKLQMVRSTLLNRMKVLGISKPST